MNYFISEKRFDGIFSRTAGGKAREDAECIFKDYGLSSITIENQDRSNLSILKKMWWHIKILSCWKKKTEHLKAGDSLVVQFPVFEHSIFLFLFFRSLYKRDVKVVLLLHDLESFRNIRRKDYSLIKRIKMWFEELPVKYCHKMIVHNQSMKEVLIQKGINADKLVNLEIFDYLIPDFEEERIRNRVNARDMAVIIAGHLTSQKAKYVYDLPSNCRFALYGPEYTGEVNDNITYFGSFPPEELPYKLEGSFGLVWDGISAKTCEGVFGEYLRINNPHKTSLYIASGLPIIIWKEAALCEFVEKNGCGISVSSLYEINEVIASKTEEEYNVMKENAMRTSQKLRAGYYLKSALERALNGNEI